MIFLVTNVIMNSIQLRFTNRESSISLLPTEMPSYKSFFVNKFGRLRFNIANQVGQCLIGIIPNKDMDMIFDTIDLTHFVIAIMNDRGDEF